MYDYNCLEKVIGYIKTWIRLIHEWLYNLSQYLLVIL